MRLSKSPGITPSERILAELAEKTFLKLWSYPNVFRAQGKRASGGDGKELCDLLVVFGSHLIIFSDKSCAMPISIDLDLAWRRWYDRAIEKSAKQIFGAERWLRNFQQQVFVDRACKQQLPFLLPSPDCWQVHRIVVAIGARERCAQEVGGSGSLQIRPTTSDKKRSDIEELDLSREGTLICRPFEVGWVDLERGFIHVLDEFTLRTLLEELDTAADFVDYLSKKEALVRSGRLEFAAGEEELLWEYLRKDDHKNSRNFDGKEVLRIFAGNWESWKKHPAYQATKKEDEVSRQVWDRLIDMAAEMALGNKLTLGSTNSLHEAELCLRTMASERRLARRGLAHAFIDRLHNSKKNVRTWRMLFCNTADPTGYVFLFYRLTDDISLDEYMQNRRIWAEGLITVHFAQNPHLKRIVAIVTEADPDCPRRTFDFIYSVPREDGVALDDGVRQIQSTLGVKDEDINAKGTIILEFVPH